MFPHLQVQCNQRRAARPPCGWRVAEGRSGPRTPPTTIAGERQLIGSPLTPPPLRSLLRGDPIHEDVRLLLKSIEEASKHARTTLLILVATCICVVSASYGVAGRFAEFVSLPLPLPTVV